MTKSPENSLTASLLSLDPQDIYSDILRNFPTSSTPYIRLLVAIIQRAILDAEPITKERRCHKANALHWLAKREKIPQPFSFQWICEILEVDPDKIRTGVGKRLGEGERKK